MNEKQIKLATAEYYDWVTTPPEKYYLLSIEQETFAKEVWMACSEKVAEHIDSSVPNGDATIDVMQNLIENNKPVGYVREWEGDVSDANNFIFVANIDELDDSPNWREVFTTPQPSNAEAKLKEGLPPKDGKTYLGYFPSKEGYFASQCFIPICWSEWGGGTWDNVISGHHIPENPTHWTDLPLSPNQALERIGES